MGVKGGSAQIAHKKPDRYLFDAGKLARDDEIAQAKARAGKQPEGIHSDKLLDEIDSILENNAEEFVRNYVQKGGQ